MDRKIEVCGWCLPENRLVILTEGVGPELALEAIEAGEASHGICKAHASAMRALIPGPIKGAIAAAFLLVGLVASAAASEYGTISSEQWARLTPEQQTFYVVGASDAFHAMGLRCPGTKSYGEQIHIMREQVRAILSRGKRLNLVSGAESLLANLRAQRCVLEEPAKP